MTDCFNQFNNCGEGIDGCNCDKGKKSIYNLFENPYLKDHSKGRTMPKVSKNDLTFGKLRKMQENKDRQTILFHDGSELVLNPDNNLTIIGNLAHTFYFKYLNKGLTSLQIFDKIKEELNK